MSDQDVVVVIDRIRQPGALIRGEDENSLLRDLSQPAFDAYDTTSAELE